MKHFTKLNPASGLCRLALAALALVATVPSALAGTYSATMVGWSGSPTLSGNASASFSGLTASYTIGDGNQTWNGNLQSTSQLVGTVQWKVTWTPAYTGDVAPSVCTATIATQLAQQAHAETLNQQSNSNTYSADAWSRDALGEFMEAKETLPAGTIDERYDNEGSTTPTSRAYLSASGSFSSDGSGNYVAYVSADLSGATFSSVTGGGVGRFQVNDCVAESSAYDAGAVRLIFVNQVQIGNDFAGGSYATSGYSN